LVLVRKSNFSLLGAELFYVSRLSEQFQLSTTACEGDNSFFLPHLLQSQFKCTLVVQGDRDFIFQNVLPDSSPAVSQIRWKTREHSVDSRVLYAKYGLLKPTPPRIYSGHAIALVNVQGREVQLRFILEE